jgi:hypothetical protein
LVIEFIILDSNFSIPFKLILSFELIIIEFGLYFSIIKLGIDKKLFVKYIVKYINDGDILINICSVKTKI